MTGDFFILEGHKVVRCDLSVGEFAKKTVASNYRVAETFVEKIRISTVFLGVDVSLDGKPPVLFETMVFDKDGDEKGCFRYTTWSEAIQGHETVVEQFAQKLGLVETSTGETLN